MLSTLQKYAAEHDIPLYWFLFLLIAVVISFLGMGTTPLMDLDEGAFTEATREMFERNDFISTYLNGNPRHDKPILFYWFQALSIASFGLNEFAMRLPSVLAGLAWGASVWWFCGQINCTARSRFIATLMLLSSLHLTVIIKVATADALLNLWLALSMFHIILFLDRQHIANLRYACLFMALGFLTKGPIALVVPFVLCAIHILLDRQFKLIICLLSDFWSWLILLGVALPWYIVVTLQDGGAFLEGFFLHHNVDRFNSKMENHGGSYFYYIPVVLLALLPYTPLLVKLCSACRKLWQQRIDRLLLIWFLLVLIMFSFSATKLPHYAIYGYSGLIVLIAVQADKVNYARWMFIPALILNIVFLLFPEILNRLIPLIKDSYLRELISDGRGFFTADFYLVLIPVIIMLMYFIAGKKQKFQEKFILAGLASSLVISVYIMPSVMFAYSTPVLESAKILKDRPEKVIFWRINMPSLSVYREHITTSEEPQSGIIVYTKTKFTDELPAHIELYRGHGVLLAKIL